MRPLLFFFSVLIALSLSACGDKEPAEQAATDSGTTLPAEGSKTMMPSTDVTTTPGSEAVPEDTPAVPVEGLFIKPFFDDAGTQAEITVKPGDQFDLVVYAETVDPYPTNAAQFRLQMPPGIRVVGTVEHDMKRMSLGTPDFNYMVAFECQQPGRYRVVTYKCFVEPDCRGGVIEALPGFLGDNRSFLGFTTCEFLEVMATGGTATVRVQ